MTLASFVRSTFLFVALPACGQSPLLHHVHDQSRNEPPIDTSTVAPKPTDETTPAPACQISLPKSNLCASLTWTVPSVPRKKKGAFELRFTRPGSNELVDAPATVGVVLWMPSMDHGSSPVTVERKGRGLYLATDVYFVMGGEWDIIVQLLQGEEEVLDQGTLKVQM